MRFLINYIRSCFCKHEWECIKGDIAVYDRKHDLPVGFEWVYRCKKCGCVNKIET